MGIWDHASVSRDITAEAILRFDCPFCGKRLKIIHTSEDSLLPFVGISQQNARTTTKTRAARCTMCGWWNYSHSKETIWRDHAYHSRGSSLWGAAGCLKKLNLSDLSTPIDEIKTYLIGRYPDVSLVHPRLFEQVVSSVFGALGYDSAVTSYSGDDGIDVFLRKGEELIGVQVKRYKNKIDVGQIRELAGAMVLNGITKGFFVTTSSFQSGVKPTIKKYLTAGLDVKTFDYDQFYEILELAQVRNIDQYNQEIIVDRRDDLIILKSDDERHFDRFY